MAPRFLFIIGLPGAGKSTLARSIIAEREAMGLPRPLLLDDPKGLQAFERLDGEAEVIVCDPHLCNPRQREGLLEFLARRYPGSHVESIWFANDPEQALRNVAHRDDGRAVRGFIQFLKGVYVIPEGADIRPVAVADTEPEPEQDSGMKLVR